MGHILLNPYAFAAPVNIEDVFSAYTYTGNGATGQTITNGIDLAGKGGLVWMKTRGSVASNDLQDTSRGINKSLVTNTTAAEYVGTSSDGITAFNSSGFTLGANNYSSNPSGGTVVSWTFRKAAKFFDVVTYTGNGIHGRTIPHSLGVAPGMIIVKITSYSGIGWAVYHRNLAISEHLRLDLTDAANNLVGPWVGTNPTATEFTVANDGLVNSNGYTYVAYLFGHDTSATGLIQCGSFTTDGAGAATITLGWEPQYLTVKVSSTTGNWSTLDSMRGFTVGDSNRLNPNTSNAEDVTTSYKPNSTGFSIGLSATTTYIYLAIRRGPMALPTVGTQVYNGYTATLSDGTIVNAGLRPDLLIGQYRGGVDATRVVDRLRGFAKDGASTNPELYVNNTNAEAASSDWTNNWTQTGYTIGATLSGLSTAIWAFSRYPGVFDEVCYTGTGSAHTEAHNLTVAPELIIVKRRPATTEYWNVYAAPLGATKYLHLNLTNAAATSSIYWNNTTPGATSFTVGNDSGVNASGNAHVAYLFATLAGVSKVGTYTGNGTNQTINCGFSAGARFVMVKATSTTGNWIVGDSTRGLVAGNDPYLLLNTTGAEVTTEDWLDPDNSGFIVNATTTAANTNGVTYIYLAFA